MSETNIDLHSKILEVLSALWRKRYLFVSILILMPISAVIIGLMMPKKFKAITSILVYEHSLLNPFLKDFAYSTELKKRITGLNVFINSPDNLEAIAKKSGLLENVNSKAGVNYQIYNLKKSLKLRLLGSNVVEFSLYQNRPDKMKDILKVVRNIFIRRLLAPRISSIDSSERFLREQIVKLTQKLLASESEMVNFKSKSYLPEHSKLFVNQLHKIEEKIYSNQVLISGVDAQIKNIKNSLINSNPILGYIEMKIINKKSEKQYLSSKLTDNHSTIKRLKTEIKQLEKQKKQTKIELKKVSTQSINKYMNISLTSSVEFSNSKYQPVLSEQLSSLQKALSEKDKIKNEFIVLHNQKEKIKLNIKQVSIYEKTLYSLKREVTVNTELLNKLKKRLAMASVTSDLGKFEQSSLVKVIQKPRIPTSPVNKPILFFFFIGLLGGFVLACSLTFILEMLDQTVRSNSEIEEITGSSILIRIGNYKK